MNHPDNLLLKTASWLLLILGVASTVRCIMELLEGAVTLIFLLSLCTALLSLLAGWVGLKACFHQNMAQLALYTGILLTFDQILYLVLLFFAGSREMLGSCSCRSYMCSAPFGGKSLTARLKSKSTLHDRKKHPPAG